MEKQFITLVVEYTPENGKPVRPADFIKDHLGAKLAGYSDGDLCRLSAETEAHLDRLEGAIEELDLLDAINQVIDNE